MSTFAELLAMVRRPTAPPPLPSRGAKAASTSTPAPVQPATEAELIEALARLEAERRAAEDAAIEAQSRREKLLLEPDADEEIHQSARDLAAAELLVERLDALEPTLRNRLQDVRNAARAARWLELRDAYVAAAERHLAFLRDYEATQRPLREAVIGPLMAEFPASVTQLHNYPPPFVGDFILPVTGAVDQFAASLEQLRSMVFDPSIPPPPLFTRVSALVDEARRTGHIDANSPPEVRRALGMEARVQFVKPVRDGQGAARVAGEVVTLSGEAAAVEIASGRATRMED